MSIQNVTSYFSNPPAAGASSNTQNSSSGSFANALADASGTSPEQAFLNYMKESPAQRMIDAWLKAHGLTEQSLQQLPPEKREAVMKEMADDLKKQAEDKTKAQLTAVS